MPETALIVLLVAASLGGTGLIAYALLSASKRQSALREAVIARGWHYDRTDASGGRAGVTTISDPDAGWRIEIKIGAVTDGSGSNLRRTSWHAADAGIDQGLAVLGPAMSAKEAAKAETMLSKLGDGMGGFLMTSMFGDLGPDATRLEAVQLDGASGLLMATPEARGALAPVATHPVMASASNVLSPRHMPIIRRSSQGLEFTLRKALTHPEEVLALADFAQTLRQALRAE